LRIYRGGSLVNAEGTALANDKGAGLEILATGNKTCYTGKLGEGGYTYVQQGDANGDGTAIPMVAAQTIGKGNIVVTGRYAYSNYEIGNDASNGAFYLKVVDYLADLKQYTPLNQIASLEEGTTVCAEGTVIDAKSGIFWIRDNTGCTVAVTGVQTGSLPLTKGTRVLVNGKITVTNGEKAIAFQSYTHQVQYIGTKTTNEIYEGFYNSTAELDAQLIARYNSGASNLDGGSAEIVVYNAARKTAYAVNGIKGTLDQIAMNSLTSGEKTSTLQTLEGKEINVKALVEGKDAEFTYGDMTSVAVSADGSLVAAALQDADYTKNGRAVLFSCSKDGSLTFKSMTETGVQPDMITFTDDGSLVLTANEGEPRQGYSAEGAVDPEGTVTIINVKDGIGETVGFGDFDGQRESLTQAGVVIKKETSPSVDFEPEYITTEGSTAYVSLQEANAVAVLDLNKKAFTGVYSIGFEDYSKTAIDLNSKDGKYEAATYDNIMGIRMPDAISSFTAGGKTYLVTANEGDSRAWPVETEADVNEIKDKKSPVTGQKFEGKVTWFDVSQYDGLKEGTDYLFGGRSFSVLEVTESGLKVVYSSGNDFEKITAEVLPEHFNCSNDTIELEDRTGKKGPEPEGITTGIVDGRTYAFIALERIGGIMMYDVTNPSKTEFVNYINSRDFSQDVKDDVSPEGMAFVAAEKSSTGNALLVAANEVSGTVSVYELTAEAKVTPPSWTPSYTPDVPAVPDVPDAPAVPDEEDGIAENVKAVRFSAKSRLTTLHGKRAVKVYWNAPEEVKLDGYQVFRSVKRYSGFTKKPFFTTSNTCYWNTKDLKAGTRYYYKVRGFKEIDGERVYTQWSTKAWRTV
ncbi:MAG: choice-of-anchor I family protein, partial [Firmicutes bacterium]|nr:choice-of-anchor I family protein [Bacillota bacterium]